MSSLQGRAALDPPYLHLAAGAFAYPIIDGSLSFSEASTILARAAIRAGLLDDDTTTSEFQRLCERLERTLGAAIMEIEQEAADDVRKHLRLCVERRMLSPVVILEIAHSVNRDHHKALPDKCLNYLIKEVTGEAATQAQGAA